MWDDSPGCPACASGWHSRCRWPELAEALLRCAELTEHTYPAPSPPVVEGVAG